MSTKPPPEQSDSTATKNKFTRQIDSAFEEASKLSGSSLAPTEFYEQFLNKTLNAIDAPAGAVWLRTPQGFLQIACQVNLDKVGLDNRRGGRQCHNEVLRQVFQATPPRPVMVEPQGRLGGVQPAEAGAVPPANLTDYYALFAPIVAPDKSPIGLLEVFQEPSHDPRLFQTFLHYTFQMAGYASQYHQFSAARASAGMEKVFAQVESFSRLIHGSLNPTQVAYHVANEGRRLVEADRLCVAVRHGKKCTVEAVSGADVVEKASTHVRRMRRLFDEVLKLNEKLVFNGTKDEGLPPDLSNALDEYLAESQPKLLVVLPVRDEEREKDDKKPARSALLMESFNPPEAVEPLVQRMELVGKHAAGALYNAAEMKRIPFGFIWRPLAKIQDGLGGKNRAIAIASAVGIVALVGGLILIPAPLKVDSKGEFLPEHVKNIFAPHDGEVRQILAKAGDTVKERQPLVSLYDPELQRKWNEAEAQATAAENQVRGINTSLSITGVTTEAEQSLRRELARYEAQAKAQRLYQTQMRNMYNLAGQPGMYIAQAPDFDASFRGQRDASWRVISADNKEALLNRTVKRDQPMLRVGYTDGPWRVEMKIPQRNIGHISRALATPGQHKLDADKQPYLDVDVLLTSNSNTSYPGRLYLKDIAGEAVPNRDDHNQSDPVVPAYVRVNQDDLPADQKIPRELFVAGLEVHAKIRCGSHASGYSLFHGVWEWFYEKVIFFV